MVRSPVQHSGMNVGFGAPRESLEEIVNQLGLKIAHEPDCTLVSRPHSSPAKIDRSQPMGFIHRHQEISGSKNPLLVTQCLVECLPEYDAYILYRVVLIDFEITVGFELQSNPP